MVPKGNWTEFLAYLPPAPQAWSEVEAGKFEVSSKESLLTQDYPKPSLGRAHSSSVLTFPQPRESAIFFSADLTVFPDSER